MPLKKLKFFDYKSCTANPISPGISVDTGRNDVYFQLDLYLPKQSMNFEKKGLNPFFLYTPQPLSENVYSALPKLINYNMELFALGNVKQGNITEYVLFFKPWYIGVEDFEDYLDYLENFIYIIPFRTLKSLLAHGIKLNNFQLQSLNTVRVLEDFNSDFFNNLNDIWRNMSQQPIPNMGAGIAEKIYEETRQITLNREYDIVPNHKYMF